MGYKRTIYSMRRRGNFAMCAEALLRDIEKYRKEMVDLAAKTSLSNQNVIDVSTKLDCLLNKYYHLSSDKTALY